MGEETFSKVEFLAAFDEFRTKAFKESTIRSAWKHTGLIPFDPKIVLDKLQIIVTPPSIIGDPAIWTTPTSRAALANCLV